MEEIKQSTKTTNLVQKLGTYNYKLVIPIEVERKIRFTCQKVWNTEWSGTLFYTYEGSFEKNDLVIRCVDIYIMDIGTQAYTEFDMNPDVIAYMTENPKLLDCQLGLIHSHAGLQTYFSGTDQQTLKEEGRDRNNFVSLIVNNEGNYTAAITRRVKTRKTKETVCFDFFDKGEKLHTTDTGIRQVDDVEWFYLKIEKEVEDYSFQDMAARLEEIRRIKAEKAKKAQIYSYKPLTINTVNNKTDLPKTVKKENNNTKVIQPSLFDDIEDWPIGGGYDIPYGQVSINKNTIKSLVLQLVTGSIIISNEDKLDITKWAKSIPTLYEKRFGKGEEGMTKFKAWADTYIDYLLWSTADTELEQVSYDEAELGYDESEITAICAHDMIEELTRLPENDYIKCFIDVLQNYLIL